MAKPSIQVFKKICEAKTGNVTNMAKAFDVERKTVYNWMKHPKWREAYDDVRESLLDFVETQQMMLIRGVPKYKDDDNGEKKFIGWIERPSESMIIHYEKTRGRGRGYGDKVEQEVTIKGNVPIKKWLEESRKQRTDKKNKK